MQLGTRVLHIAIILAGISTGQHMPRSRSAGMRHVPGSRPDTSMRVREISAQVTGIRHPVFMELRWMTPVDADAVSAARHLFDHEVRLEWVEHFLAQPDHHLCIAYASGEPSGFV